MWQSYLNGILVAAGLIIAIGAQNAFVLAQSLRREHHLSVAALCVFCDAVLVSLGVFGLAKLLLENPTLLAIARWGGIAFLTWYGLKALLRALRPDALGNAAETGPRSRKAVLLAALAVTLLNPHVYLDTVLLIGSLGAQQAAPGAYALGAASASLMWFFALALGAAWLAPWLARPATWRLLDLMVAAMMLAWPRNCCSGDNAVSVFPSEPSRRQAVQRECGGVRRRACRSPSQRAAAGLCPYSCCVDMPRHGCYDPEFAALGA